MARLPIFTCPGRPSRRICTFRRRSDAHARSDQGPACAGSRCTPGLPGLTPCPPHRQDEAPAWGRGSGCLHYSRRGSAKESRAGRDDRLWSMTEVPAGFAGNIATWALNSVPCAVASSFSSRKMLKKQSVESSNCAQCPTIVEVAPENSGLLYFCGFAGRFSITSMSWDRPPRRFCHYPGAAC